MRTILAITMALVLSAPSAALADKKKTSSGKDGPTENINLNYSKTQVEYATQKPAPKSGVNGPVPVPYPNTGAKTR